MKLSIPKPNKGDAAYKRSSDYGYQPCKAVPRNREIL